MKHPIAVTLAAATLLAAPASANPFVPPAGCDVFLTVQSRQCSVSHLYRCESAPDGGFAEAIFDGDGMSAVVGYGPTYQWQDSVYMWDNSREVLVPPAEDPIEIDTLADEGIDTFRFTMHRTAPGEDREITIVGADTLTGETTTIDGLPLEIVQTQLQILTEDGTVEYSSRGVQYLSREKRLFFLGPEEVYDDAGEATPYDNSPVDFIEPGEPGFASSLPLYECDQQKAGLTPAPVSPGAGEKETDHDQI
ncbi:hypothetical protein [Maritimibacter sp. UBA3975]|uniref:hypothetical protein n=1 Tax=Maritimibacter sp. UBA3975 TaxID=1946833 RepID=UPI000C096781|nr:hypothetical protein [Maritimibacter sp. UBA3975]MAM63262.1 hypothetical protein [Maritimibacter sp.]|tara:strand:+ start:8839 stop:9588 length:750 start_codon:yes stop_codon:yes gene_type:complete